jgi:adenine-specific DNA-methyltransferase
VRGKGRGGSVRRAAAQTDGFDLSQAEPPQAPAAPATPRRRLPQAGPTVSGAPEVLSYRHSDTRKNNPEVGVVSFANDPDVPCTRWRYDPHIDPALQFDSARARVEGLIDAALESGDPQAMRAALEDIKRDSVPYLKLGRQGRAHQFRGRYRLAPCP